LKAQEKLLQEEKERLQAELEAARAQSTSGDEALKKQIEELQKTNKVRLPWQFRSISVLTIQTGSQAPN